MSGAAREGFEAVARDNERFLKLELVHQLFFGILSKAAHHMEHTKAQSLWLKPLFDALSLGAAHWAGAACIEINFKQGALGKALSVIQDRWKGEHGSRSMIAPLRSSAHVIACLLGPCCAPAATAIANSEWEGAGWKGHVEPALKKLCSSDLAKLDHAVEEARSPLLRHGGWGDVAAKRQQSIAFPESQRFDSNVEKIIAQQAAMASALSLWKLEGAQQFLLVSAVAARLAALAAQSADVERSCKAHKLTHTKAHNHLKSSSVRNLIFDCVSLRLLARAQGADAAKASIDVSDFLSQALDDEAEEVVEEEEAADVGRAEDKGGVTQFDDIEEGDEELMQELTRRC